MFVFCSHPSFNSSARRPRSASEIKTKLLRITLVPIQQFKHHRYASSDDFLHYEVVHNITLADILYKGAGFDEAVVFVEADGAVVMAVDGQP